MRLTHPTRECCAGCIRNPRVHSQGRIQFYFVTSSDYPDYPDVSKSYPDISVEIFPIFGLFFGCCATMLTASKFATDDARTDIVYRRGFLMFTFFSRDNNNNGGEQHSHNKSELNYLQNTVTGVDMSKERSL